MNNLDALLESGAEQHLTKYEGCDQAIIGIGYRCGQQPLYIYDYITLVGIFQEQGMELEEAEEWVDYNIVNAWIGEGTPIVMYNQ